MFQKDGALAQWYRARTEGGRRGVRKTMIVALYKFNCNRPIDRYYSPTP